MALDQIGVCGGRGGQGRRYGVLCPLADARREAGGSPTSADIHQGGAELPAAFHPDQTWRFVDARVQMWWSLARSHTPFPVFSQFKPGLLLDAS